MAEYESLEMGWSGSGWMDPSPMSYEPEPMAPRRRRHRRR